MDGIKSLQKITPFKVAPTAQLFNIIKQKYPKLKIYKSGGHPSKIARYLFAYTFYKMTSGHKDFVT